MEAKITTERTGKKGRLRWEAKRVVILGVWEVAYGRFRRSAIKNLQKHVVTRDKNKQRAQGEWKI